MPMGTNEERPRRLNPEEFQAKYPLMLNWIRQTLAAHAPKARQVASLGLPRLPHYLTPATVASAKVVAVDVVPVPPLTGLGLSQFAPRSFLSLLASLIGLYMPPLST
jgi:hypothetical protein